MRLTKTSNNREAGWLTIKELLKPAGADGSPRLYIFNTCRRLIADLPALNIDPKKPSDCATEPHDCTHAPDALRALAIYHFRPAYEEREKKRAVWTQDMYEDYYAAATQAERDYIIARYGDPF